MKRGMQSPKQVIIPISNKRREDFRQLGLVNLKSRSRRGSNDSYSQCEFRR